MSERVEQYADLLLFAVVSWMLADKRNVRGMVPAGLLYSSRICKWLAEGFGRAGMRAEMAYHKFVETGI